MVGVGVRAWVVGVGVVGVGVVGAGVGPHGVDRRVVQLEDVLEAARAHVHLEELARRAAHEHAPLQQAVLAAAARARRVDGDVEEHLALVVLQRHAAHVQLAPLVALALAQPPEAHVLVAVAHEGRVLEVAVGAGRLLRGDPRDAADVVHHAARVEQRRARVGHGLARVPHREQLPAPAVLADRSEQGAVRRQRQRLHVRGVHLHAGRAEEPRSERGPESRRRWGRG